MGPRNIREKAFLFAPVLRNTLQKEVDAKMLTTL